MIIAGSFQAHRQVQARAEHISLGPVMWPSPRAGPAAPASVKTFVTKHPSACAIVGRPYVITATSRSNKTPT